MLWEINMSEKLSDKDMVLAESVLKISAIQRLLVKKNLVTETELFEEMSAIGKEIQALIK
jgi:hypothetical protein